MRAATGKKKKPKGLQAQWVGPQTGSVIMYGYLETLCKHTVFVTPNYMQE